MSYVMTQLSTDHANLAKLLNALERQLAAFDRGETPDYELIEAVLDYVLNYPDVHHHPLEDKVLARLRSRDAEAANAVGALDQEHADLHALTARCKAAVDGILLDQEIPRETVHGLTAEVLEAYRKHMTMENTVFFPEAERALTPEDWDALDEEARATPSDPLFGSDLDRRYAMLRDDILSWDASAAES